MAFIPPFAPGAAEPDNVADVVVDQFDGVNQENAGVSNSSKNSSLLSFWHAIANTFGAEQGFSKQIRNNNGADIGAAFVNTYGGHTAFFTTEAYTSDGSGANAESFILEETNDTEHGIDWRSRYIFIINNTPLALAGEAGDFNVGRSIALTGGVGVATVTVTDSQGNAGLNTSLGWTFTEAGLAGDPTAANFPVRSVEVLNILNGVIVRIHACSTTAGAFTEGDLLWSSLANGPALGVPRMSGLIIASPQFIAS